MQGDLPEAVSKQQQGMPQRALRAADKSSLGSYEFTPYGNVHAQTGVALAGLGGAFTGKPWDATAQLYFFPYRYYSPDAARWLTGDPLGMVDGSNVYVYVRYQPTMFSDPLGLYRITTRELGCKLIAETTERRAYRCLWTQQYRDWPQYGQCLKDCLATSTCESAGGFFAGIAAACGCGGSMTAGGLAWSIITGYCFRTCHFGALIQYRYFTRRKICARTWYGWSCWYE